MNAYMLRDAIADVIEGYTKGPLDGDVCECLDSKAGVRGEPRPDPDTVVRELEAMVKEGLLVARAGRYYLPSVRSRTLSPALSRAVHRIRGFRDELRPIAGTDEVTFRCAGDEFLALAEFVTEAVATARATMPFLDAWREVVAGGQVSRLGWPDGRAIFRSDGAADAFPRRIAERIEGCVIVEGWQPTPEDLLADDWVALGLRAVRVPPPKGVSLTKREAG